MSDDLTEFAEVAGSGRKTDLESASPGRPSRLLEKPSDPIPQGSKSSVSQYTKAGDAFLACGVTTESLPPNCYTVAVNMDGQIMFKPQNIVTDSLMRLPDSKSDEVIDEIQHFWTIKHKFKEYGFAHKRGFLLWGPPGSGKTSCVAIVVSDMVKTGGLIFLCDNPELLALGLNQIRLIEPQRPIVVIMEDLDTIIYRYGESTVLSLLDGEHQIENVCYVATTNYPENLDGRIVNRPSRFDRIVKIGMPNAEARALYIKNRIGELTKDGVDLVASTKGYSIAHLKELIISVYCQGNSVKDTLTRLDKMRNKPSSDRDSKPLGLG